MHGIVARKREEERVPTYLPYCCLLTSCDDRAGRDGTEHE